MSTASTKQNKCPETENRGVEKADNPIHNKRVVLCFIDVMLRIYKIERELGVKDASALMLFTIIAMYERENRPISQYEIAKQCFALNATVQTYQRCRVMTNKGILEAVGRSKYNSPMFVPSYRALSVIGKYFTLVEVEYIMNELYPLPLVA